MDYPSEETPSNSAHNSDFISSGKLRDQVRNRPFRHNFSKDPDALKVDFLGFLLLILRFCFQLRGLCKVQVAVLAVEVLCPSHTKVTYLLM